MALLLRRRGIERVRPLLGGFYGWRDRGYPTVDIVPTPMPADVVPPGPRGPRATGVGTTS